MSRQSSKQSRATDRDVSGDERGTSSDVVVSDPSRETSLAALDSMYDNYIQLYIHFDQLRWQLPLLATGGVGLVATGLTVVFQRIELGLLAGAVVGTALLIAGAFLAIVAQAWSRILSGQDETVRQLNELETILRTMAGTNSETFFMWRARVLASNRRRKRGRVGLRGVSAQMSAFLWTTAVVTAAGGLLTLAVTVATGMQ